MDILKWISQAKDLGTFAFSSDFGHWRTNHKSEGSTLADGSQAVRDEEVSTWVSRTLASMPRLENGQGNGRAKE
jgi:hypothetical protein